MVLESHAGALAFITTVLGTVMALSYFLQAYKIAARKSVEDISLPMFAISFIAVACWLLYGLSISNPPLIIANAIGTMGLGGIILLYLRYRKRY